MKNYLKPLVFIVLGLSATALNAQMYLGTTLTPTDRQKSTAVRDEYRDRFQKNGVKTITTASQEFKKGKAKGEMNTVMQQEFDQSGQNIATTYIDHKGRSTAHLKFDYDDEGNVTQRSFLNRKGETRARTEFSYAHDMLLGYNYLEGSRLVCKRRYANEYDEMGFLQKRMTYNGRSGKIVEQFKCSYYEDGSKKRLETYNGRNKLKMATDYACGEEGKAVDKTKAEERIVCERFEHTDDGQTVKIVETLSDEKDESRIITKLDERGNILERSTFDKAGAMTKRDVSTYDMGGWLLSSAHYVKGDQLKYRFTYERDAKGMALSEVQENGKGEVLSRKSFAYTYF